jgi:hypothetical protein
MEANMKRPVIWLLILAIFATGSFTACSPGESAHNRMNCSTGGEVCIYLSTVDSFSTGDPVALKVKVTSSNEISDIHLRLHTSPEVTVDGPQGWEDFLSYTSIEMGYADWDFAIKAGQTLTFNRVLHFPVKEGWFYVNAEVVNTGRTLVGTDSFGVLITKGDGKVLREGTPPPPYTPNVTAAAYGPGTPVPTALPAQPFPWETTSLPATDTPLPPIKTNPTPTQLVPLVATSTSTSNPYPGSSPYP